MFLRRMVRDHSDLDNSLLKELKSCCARETKFLPKESGLKLLETKENPGGLSAKCRDSEVEELWGLTSFFGYSTQSFVQAVNVLDRFLAVMKPQRKHLPCVAVCCLQISAKMVEDESGVSPTSELIRISQSKFTESDLCKMETTIKEKIDLEPDMVTALNFLHLFYSAVSSIPDIPCFGKLEAQLKSCLCRLVFSKAKQSVLALSLMTNEFEALSNSSDSLKMLQQFQRSLKISDGELRHWRDLVAERMAAYRSGRCNRPDHHKKLVFLISRRTAQSVQAGHLSVPGLPTIPEGSWDQSESDDSAEEMSCSPCGSLGSDGEGSFFTSTFL